MHQTRQNPNKPGTVVMNFRGWNVRNGAEDRSRTDDLLITNQLLYQLSYFGLLLLKLYSHGQIR